MKIEIKWYSYRTTEFILETGTSSCEQIMVRIGNKTFDIDQLTEREFNTILAQVVQIGRGRFGLISINVSNERPLPTSRTTQDGALMHKKMT